jgi:uncharacterized membrane protein YidH (DUF202 family)
MESKNRNHSTHVSLREMAQGLRNVLTLKLAIVTLVLCACGAPLLGMNAISDGPSSYVETSLVIFVALVAIFVLVWGYYGWLDAKDVKQNR